MPAKKIAEIVRSCQSNEHNPPSMMVWSDGVYEHTCPACGAKQIFTVTGPRFQPGVQLSQRTNNVM
jgi:hypothetical protein